MNRTATPDAVVAEQLAEKIKHRARLWLRGEPLHPSPGRYAEHACELMRKAVDPDAV